MTFSLTAVRRRGEGRSTIPKGVRCFPIGCVLSHPFVCSATHFAKPIVIEHASAVLYANVRKYASMDYRRAGDITEPRNDFHDLLHPDSR